MEALLGGLDDSVKQGAADLSKFMKIITQTLTKCIPKLCSNILE